MTTVFIFYVYVFHYIPNQHLSTEVKKKKDREQMYFSIPPTL